MGLKAEIPEGKLQMRPVRLGCLLFLEDTQGFVGVKVCGVAPPGLFGVKEVWDREVWKDNLRKVGGENDSWLLVL